MNGYTKLFSSILTSTLWGEPGHVRLVWITMLALADARGRVKASVPGLARQAGVTLEEAEEAVSKFLSPDRYSRTREHDGRRIAEFEEGGGWTLLNYAKYREAYAEEVRKEQYRQSKARTRKSIEVVDMSTNETSNRGHVHTRPQMSTQAEAEAEADPNTKRLGTASPSATAGKASRRKPETPCPSSCASPEEVTEWAARWAIPVGHAEFPNFLDTHRKKDSRWRDWAAAWRTWLRRAPEFARQGPYSPPGQRFTPKETPDQAKAFAKALAARVAAGRGNGE